MTLIFLLASENWEAFASGSVEGMFLMIDTRVVERMKKLANCAVNRTVFSSSKGKIICEMLLKALNLLDFHPLKDYLLKFN